MSSLTIYKRELRSYFGQPTAYAIIVIFLALSMGLTFSFGNFMRIGDASLEWSFFFWHPWIYMLLAPAVGMKLWSDEQRNGTIELLGTLPVSMWSAIIGKFLAAATVWLAALVLTFPILATVNYLGDPDNGAILAGYIGSLLVCSTFVAITMLVSACTRDQVVCLIVSVAICVTMVLCGYDDFTREIGKAVSPGVVEAIVSIGVWDHFRSLNRGLLRLQDAVWFASFIAVCLLSGYAWLAVAAGIIVGAGGFAPGTPGYGAAMHALTLGFVFSMVFGHAPIIFPAVLRVAVPYHRTFYLPLALLHLSLIVRLAGDAAGRFEWTRSGGLLHAVALAAFIIGTASAVVRGARARRPTRNAPRA
jgi:ABC-2 type transport system permease protein